MSILEKLNNEQFVTLIENEADLLMWSLVDGNYYANTRHFSIRVTDKEVKEPGEYDFDWDLRSYMKGIFGRHPQEGQTLMMHFGKITEKDSKIINSLVENHKKKPSNAGVVTPCIYAHGIFRHRWAKFAGFDLFVQDMLISLLYDVEDEPVYSDGPESPAYFCDGDLFILPVRNVGDWVPAELQDLEKATKKESAKP